MIRSVEIKNFRGIQDGTLKNLTPLVILVGPNGCGKSTILDALLIGASPAPGGAVVQVVNRRNSFSRGARWLFRQARLSGESIIKVSPHDSLVRTCRLTIDPATANSEDSIVILCAVSEERDSSSKTSGVVSAEFDRSSSYSKGLFTALEGVPEISLIGNRANLFPEPLYTLYTKTVERGRRTESRDILSEVVPELKDIVILTEGEKPVIYLEFKDYSIPITMAGDGVQELLRLSLELASRPSGVVLMEEPEVHQHPGAIRQSAKAIFAAVRRDIQVILSTHSLDLIDALLSEVQSDEELEKLSLYGLKLEEGCLKSYRLSGSEVALARTQIEDDLR